MRHTGVMLHRGVKHLHVYRNMVHTNFRMIRLTCVHLVIYVNWASLRNRRVQSMLTN